MSAPASINASPTCAGCFFGAVSSVSITPEYRAVETITVASTPWVYLYSNGSSSTSWESHTLSTTFFVGDNSTAATATYAGPTFDNIEDITWTIGDKTLTYGTTYYQYLGFEGATASSSGETCAQATDATEIELPTSTEEASFIYPYTAGAGLPAELLEYLESIPTISAQLSGEDLAACAPLTTSRPQVTTLDISAKEKRFEGARREISTPRLNATSLSSNHTTYPGNGTGDYTQTTTWKTAPNPENSQFTISYAPPAYSSPRATVPGTPVVGHTTAYVVSRLTVSPRTVPVPADSAPTPAPNPSPEPILNPSADETRLDNMASPEPTDNEGGGGGGSGGEPTQDPGRPDSTPNLGGLWSVVASAVNNAASPGSGQDRPSQPTGAAPVFNVGDIVVSTNSNGDYQFATQVLTPGQKITVGGAPSTTELVLQTGGGSPNLIVDGSTYRGTVDAPQITAPAVITVDGRTYTASQDSGSVAFAGASSTIIVPPGSQTVIDNQTISAASPGTAIVIDGQNYILPPSTSSMSSANTELIITINSHTFTAQDREGSVILQDSTATITLDDGSQTTFASETVSVLESGNGLVIDGSITTTFGVASKSAGDYIQSGIGVSPTTEGGSEPSETGGGPDGDAPDASTSGSALSVLASSWLGIWLMAMVILM